MTMDLIDIGKAKKIAENKGLKPGKVKGTNGLQLTKGNNSSVEVISWDEFEKIMQERGLSVYESGGFMKIMKTSTAPSVAKKKKE